MFRGLLDFFNVLMAWGFAYVVAIMIMVFGITHIKQTNQTPVIHHTTHEHITLKVIEPKPVIVEQEVCNQIIGCPIVEGECVGCVTEKVVLR